MAPKTSRSGYTGMQIGLHWLIAVLIAFQIIFGEDIKPAWRAFSRGAEPSADAMFNANLHVYLGIAVLALAILRLALRIRYGAPPPPPGETAIQKWIAAATQLLLYLAIFAVPITGLAAWFGGVEAAGEIHEIGKPIFIIFVSLHVIGALYQHFVAKTDVLVRIFRPAR